MTLGTKSWPLKIRSKVKKAVLSLKCHIYNRKITILYKNEQKWTEEANFNLRGGYGCYYLFQEGRGKLPFLGSKVIDPRLKHYKLHEWSLLLLLIDIPGSEYIQCFVYWFGSLRPWRLRIRLITLLPLANFSNLHKTKMAASVLLNIL